MKIDVTNSDWATATVEANEVWQVQEGVVFVDRDSNAGTRHGIRLAPTMDAAGFQWLTAGTAYYRLASGTKALIGIVRP